MSVLAARRGALAQIGAGSVFVSDALDDAAGVLLPAHVGALGATHTKHPLAGAANASFTNANRLGRTTASTVALYYASGIPGSPDYDVEADFFIASALATSVGIVGRQDPDVLTNILARTNGTSWALFKNVAGVATQLGPTFTGANTVGATYHGLLQVRGPLKRFWLDGTLVISATDTAVTAAGRVGVRFSVAQTDATGVHLDNLVATNF